MKCCHLHLDFLYEKRLVLTQYSIHIYIYIYILYYAYLIYLFDKMLFLTFTTGHAFLTPDAFSKNKEKS